jgi:hypothetical protein
MITHKTEFYENIDAGTLLLWYVEQNPTRASAAMNRINFYLEAARVQMQRIWTALDEEKRLLDEDLKLMESYHKKWAELRHMSMEEKFNKLRKLEKEMSRGNLERTKRIALRQQVIAQVFADIHFYFICWDTIHKMMKVLKKYSGFKSAIEVYKTHQKTLEQYAAARNHHEHLDERLPGGKRDMGSDLGNLVTGGKFSFGGEKWDVTPSSLKLLEKIVAELNSKICEEGLIKRKESPKTEGGESITH